MASNPFLDAINFNIPQSTQSNFDPNAFAQSLMSGMHGADLSSMQPTWNTSPDFIKAIANSSPSGGSPTIPASVTASSGPSFWDRLKSAATGAWNDTLGKEYSQAKGFMRGFATMFNDNEGNYTGGHFDLPTLVKALTSPLYGYMNPAQEASKYQASQNKLAQMPMPQQARNQLWAWNALEDTATDPLTFVPLGTAAKAAKIPEILKAAAKATGKTTGAIYDTSVNLAKKALPTTFENAKSAADIGRSLKNAKNAIFEPLAGTRDYFKQAVTNRFSREASDANKISKQLSSIFKGVPVEQRIALTHALEMAPVGQSLSDPLLERLRTQIEPLMQQAKELAKSKGLLTSEINPADKGVGRYIPHIIAGKFSKEGAPLTDEELLANLLRTPATGGTSAIPEDETTSLLSKVANPLKPAIDANKNRLIQGSIQDINSRVKSDSSLQGVLARLGLNPQGKVFEDDMLKILGSHLHQLNSKVHYRDFLDQVLANAEHVPKELPEDTLSGMIHDETQTPLGQVRPVDKEGAYLLPKSEADYVNKLAQHQSDARRLMDTLYRGSTNAANHLMFASSPLIHVLNNLGWQTLAHDPAIFGKMMNKDLWKQALVSGIEPGSTMDDALRAGALHTSSEIGTKGTTQDRVKDLVKSVDTVPNPLRTLGNTAKKVVWDSTPDIEKVYRTAAFQHRLEQGDTPEQAAKWIQRIYGGHIPGQTSAMDVAGTTVMPFYNWTKTAITSNAKNALERPAPYVGLFNAMNDANKQTTGHGLADNKQPLSVGLPEHNAQGRQEFWEPYIPALDVAKLYEKVKDMGLGRGLLNFIFNRSNPLLKDAATLGTGKQNPFAPTLDQYDVVPNPLLGSEANKRGIFFGDQGPKVPATLAQVAQNTANPFGDVASMQGNGPIAQMLTNPFISAGGYINAPDPLWKQKEDAFQASEKKREQSRYAKQQQSGK